MASQAIEAIGRSTPATNEKQTALTLRVSTAELERLTKPIPRWK